MDKVTIINNDFKVHSSFYSWSGMMPTGLLLIWNSFFWQSRHTRILTGTDLRFASITRTPYERPSRYVVEYLIQKSSGRLLRIDRHSSLRDVHRLGRDCRSRSEVRMSPSVAIMINLFWKQGISVFCEWDRPSSTRIDVVGSRLQLDSRTNQIDWMEMRNRWQVPVVPHSRNSPLFDYFLIKFLHRWLHCLFERETMSIPISGFCIVTSIPDFTIRDV